MQYKDLVSVPREERIRWLVESRCTLQLEHSLVEHQSQLNCIPLVIEEDVGVQTLGWATAACQSADPVPVLKGQSSGLVLAAEKSAAVHGLAPGNSGEGVVAAIVPAGSLRAGKNVTTASGRRTGECTGSLE